MRTRPFSQENANLASQRQRVRPVAVMKKNAKCASPFPRRALRRPKSAPAAEPFPIVGIGASAGGLEALEQFLRSVPVPCGLAFVIVQHLDPTHEGVLPELLQRSTPMNVVQVKDRTRIINLIPGDVGRPVTDLASDLLYPELVADARHVLETLGTVEKSIPARDGRWFALRLMPYRTTDNRIDGVVFTFADITTAKVLESELRARLQNAKTETKDEA